MLAKVQSAAVLGIDAYIVKVELDVSEGLPSFNTVGVLDVAIKGAPLVVLLAGLGDLFKPLEKA